MMMEWEYAIAKPLGMDCEGWKRDLHLWMEDW